jgi:hypothetical protein
MAKIIWDGYVATHPDTICAAWKQRAVKLRRKDLRQIVEIRIYRVSHSGLTTRFLIDIGEK